MVYLEGASSPQGCTGFEEPVVTSWFLGVSCLLSCLIFLARIMLRNEATLFLYCSTHSRTGTALVPAMTVPSDNDNTVLI